MDVIFWKFVGIGFFAQFIDGALGMAYGVISTAFLLGAGILPAAASASVHVSKVFTTVVSGVSHLLNGNVDRRLFRVLMLGGMLGAVLGVLFVASLPATRVKSLVAVYLFVVGGFIVSKALRRDRLRHGKRKGAGLLGFVGGFLDAAGGGGWGPVVTTNLLNRGLLPRYAIGTVSMAEFFVSVIASLTFLLTIGIGYWRIICGLILGGMLAAPLAAYFCRKIPPHLMMFIVGIIIMILSVRTLLSSFP